MNFYQILNSNYSDSQSQIKRNYYKLCKKYHPDKNNNLDNNLIKKINLAYEVLGDPSKRRNYNKYINKTNKSSLDHLNILYIIYKTISNHILKKFIKNTIINYLTITQVIDIKFEDIYNNSTQKISLITKNYNNNINNDINLEFQLNKTKFVFHKCGDTFEKFTGDVNIKINIDYSNYDNFCIINNKLFYKYTNDNLIKLPDFNTLDIKDIKWKKTEYGTLAIISNFGLITKNNIRDLITIYK